MNSKNETTFFLMLFLFLLLAGPALAVRKARRFDVKKNLPIIAICALVGIVCVALLVNLVQKHRAETKRIEDTTAQLEKIVNMAPMAQKDVTQDFKSRVSKDLHNDAWGNPIDMTYHVDEFHTAFVARSWGSDEKKDTEDDIAIRKEKSHIAKGVGESVSKGAIQIIKGAYKGAKEEIVGE